MMGLLTVLIIATFLHSAEGIQCFFCSGQVGLSTCVNKTECASDEECYVERIIRKDGVFYDAGCRKVQICHYLALVHRKRADLSICQECCGDNLCNKDMCLKNNTQLKEMYCYECDEVKSPRDCHKRVTCKNNEICSTTEYFDDNMELRYSLKCEAKTRCDLLQTTKREIPFWSLCCPLSGCNRHLFGVPDNTTTKSSQLLSSTEATPGCSDNPFFDCAKLNTKTNICNPLSPATMRYCPKFCGVCGMLDATTMPTTTTTPAPCVDNPAIHCKRLDEMLSVCHPITSVSKQCMKYCNLCEHFHPTTHAPTTTVAPCIDDPYVDCKGLNSIRNICHPFTEQTKLCSRFCGLCGTTMNSPATTPSSIPITVHIDSITQPTTTSTGPCVDDPTIDCKLLNSMLNICHPVRPMTMKCRRFCGLCDLAKSTNTMTTTTTTTTVVPQTTKAVTSLCYQCGNLNTSQPCSPREVNIGQPLPCHDKYCMTDVMVQADGRSYDIYKRCVDKHICETKWFSQTSDVYECIHLETDGGSPGLSCHYCCEGDACNYGLVPQHDTFYGYT